MHINDEVRILLKKYPIMPEIIENWGNYADLISDNYPWYGSQIDWDKTLNHLSMKLDSKNNIGESLIKFINQNKLDHLFKKDKYLIYINDSSLDYGIKFNSEIWGTTHSTLSPHLNTNRSKIIRPAKTIQTESTHLVQKQAVWNVWDSNRILQDHNGKHVFTTVFEADNFIPLARLVWLDDQLTQAANDETVPKVNLEKLDQLNQIALQNIGELGGLDATQTTIPQATSSVLVSEQNKALLYCKARTLRYAKRINSTQ